MKYLFDSTGRHIANEVDGRLHALTGENIGQFLAEPRIFIDLGGRYLGEIVAGNRLMSNTASAFLRKRFGQRRNLGSSSDYGNPGRAGGVVVPAGFEDIAGERLGQPPTFTSANTGTAATNANE